MARLEHPLRPAGGGSPGPGAGSSRLIEQQLGPTAMVFMNVSGADPLGTLRFYGEQVLPQLRR